MKLRCSARNAITSLALTSGLGVLLLLFLGTLQLTHADQKPQAFKPDQNWLATVQNNIEAQEYRPSKQMVGLQGEKVKEPKWHINNRAQGFKSAVSKDGWEIAPRPPAKKIDPKDPTKHLKETAAKKDEAPKWHWRYRFSALSRGAERTKLATPEVSDRDETVYLKYSPSVSEWYKNSKLGIEQGFEIKEKPHAKGKGELVLVGEVKTDLAVNKRSKEKISFSKNGAELVQYAGLKVLDASGKVIPSWLSYTARGRTQQLFIHIDDSQAVYPVLVDPLATSPAWTFESNQSGGVAGRSVSSAGDVNGDGYSDVLVGARGFTQGQVSEGKAFLFLGSASGLATTAAWTGQSDQDNAYYGIVAPAGDVNGDGYADVLVGADNYSNGESGEGRAYLYLGSAAGLATTAAWIAESNQILARYAFSLGSAGDVNGDGYADVAVGAYQYDNGSNDEGQVYVYLGSASGLATTAAWVGESNQADARFGICVRSAGDVNNDGKSDLLVGADLFDNGQSNEGRAFLYLGSPTGLGTTAAWTVEGNQVDAFFGSELSSAGDVNGDGFSDVLVSAFAFDNGETNEGRTYLYLGSASGPGSVEAWATESNQADAYYGATLADAGDTDADGYADILIGALYQDNGEVDEGLAYLYLGSASGLASTPSWVGESNQGGAWYGEALGTAGDVNGDGAADVIVGAGAFDNGIANEGQAFLYLGSSAVTPTPTPVPISIGGGGLPAPAVVVSERSATVVAPEVDIELSPRARAEAIKKLMQRGLTRAQANRALQNLVVTYIFTVTQSGGVSGKSSDDVDAQRSTITRRSKSNRLTLNKLPPGAKTVSYRIEVATRKPPVVLGSTKPSSKTRFTVPRS